VPIEPSPAEAAEGGACVKRAWMQCSPVRADVAQLVEQRFRKPQVAGSIPAVGSLIFDCRLPSVDPGIADIR